MSINIDGQTVCSKNSHDIAYDSKVDEVGISARMGFIRRVYSILAVQFILISLIGSIALFTPIMRFYINENAWLVTIGFLSCIILLTALMAKRRESPANYILLTALTAAEVYTVAVIVAYYDQMAVLQVFVLTTCSIIALTIYGLQDKKDFSSFYAGLFSCIIILFFAGFFQMFLGSTQMEVLISIVGSIAFTLFIVYDTHKIMQRLSPKEYVVGAIDMYLDVINVFFHMVRSVLPFKLQCS